MPPPLPDELVEEVLLRFPPENPAGLVQAGLVCTRWYRLVSDPGFHRRFREFHRRAPLLGMLCNCNLLYDKNLSRFIPTTAFPSPHTDVRGMRVLDARHGRVLGEMDSVLVVWDPITDKAQELPFPQKRLSAWTAAVLCSDAGACDHLDCHHGAFLVVFVSSQYSKTLVYTYSSDATAWSGPVSARLNYYAEFCTGSALVGTSLYFGSVIGSIALKYDLELCELSLILLPLPYLWQSTWRQSLLTTTEDGGLGLVHKDHTKLYIWSTKDTHAVDAKWERRVIELKTVFPVDVGVDAKLVVVGRSGVGIVFMRTGDEVYTIDVNTYKVKKVYVGTTHTVLPFMSFYTPALKGICPGEGPSAGYSST